MLKAIKITQLNTSKDLEYKCEICKDYGTIHLENSLVTVNEQGEILGETDEECQNGHRL